jgi:DNA-binding PadR family transcriptional regulator
MTSTVHKVDLNPNVESRMPRNTFLGEFEQMVLLAILQGGEDANAFEVRKELESSAGRTVTKGAFYTTLDRLERKKYLTWTMRVAEQGRGGMPQRHFNVAPAGVRELRKSRDALVSLWRDGVLEPR